MQIESIEADNFKSLVGFRLELAKFSCLIGLNGSGKSTVLQFIDFLAQQVRGDLTGWLRERGWRARELFSRLPSGKNIAFNVKVTHKKREIVWSGNFDPTELQCTIEDLKTADASLTVRDGKYSIRESRGGKFNKDHEEIPFTYQGSILSQLRKDVLPESLYQFKDFFLETESLDTLTPERLRKRTRDAGGSLGHGGRNLSAFLYEIGSLGRNDLSKKLKPAYDKFNHVYAKSLRSGWKQLRILETFEGKKLLTEAAHVNDGMLRLIAILAELASGHKLLLFDEIENGINPELVEFVTETLVNAEQQVLVTTHSPMILNYLDDEIAKRGVLYTYKTLKGHTRAIPFFGIPSLAEKLSVMGPGEVFADTSLNELAEEIAQMPKEQM